MLVNVCVWSGWLMGKVSEAMSEIRLALGDSLQKPGPTSGPHWMSGAGKICSFPSCLPLTDCHFPRLLRSLALRQHSTHTKRARTKELQAPRQFRVSLCNGSFFWPQEDVSHPVSTENATSFSQALLRWPAALNTSILVSISAPCAGW